MKLLLGIPTTDYVHAEFVKSLCGLVNRLAEDEIKFETKIIGGTLVYIARNKIAHYAIENEFTHVLWLDSDMTFGPGILDDLLFHGKEMVCGMFASRRPPYGSCVYSSIEGNNITKVEDFGTEPFKVAGCGFATVLTSVELLNDVFKKFGTVFTPTTMYGEDLAFCKRVQDIGREIWCDPTVRPGHIAHITVYAGGEQK